MEDIETMKMLGEMQKKERDALIRKRRTYAELVKETKSPQVSERQRIKMEEALLHPPKNFLGSKGGHVSPENFDSRLIGVAAKRRQSPELPGIPAPKDREYVRKVFESRHRSAAPSKGKQTKNL